MPKGQATYRAAKGKEIRKFMKIAQQNGWSVSITGKSHLRFRSPNGKHQVIGPMSPSDGRGIKNFQAKLRHAGLPV